jgi:pimeloyl-ACP methyl ester carboxylesterase
MTERAPIHLGSGEPMLLLHPFMMSQNVWKRVAPLIADTGRYEVFAPTMPGHNGGAKGPFFLDSGSLADDVERRLDALGWDTAHIVGNSLGGWVSFELERRGRARSITAIAPAGGWSDFSPVKFEIVAKFLAGGPALLAARLLGAERILRLPFARRIATLAVSGPADGPRHPELVTLIEDATHCPAYIQLLIKSLTAPGLKELANAQAPVHLVTCEFDRVLPHPRYSTHFTGHLPSSARVSRLAGVGHIPMLEAPGRITELIEDFIDEHTAPVTDASAG